MKSAPFEYHRPDTVEEAVALLAELGDEARPLAGGQSLIPLMAMRLARPTQLIDIEHIDGLQDVHIADGELGVGAMARQRTVEGSREVAEACPLLHAVLPYIGHAPIRSRGTVGGSLAHADAAAELPLAAAVLDAELVLRSVRGERRVPAAQFFVGYFTTAMASDELLVQARFPIAAPGGSSAFREVSRRHGDFAIVGVAAVVELRDDGTIAKAALGFSGADSTPVRATNAEGMLLGRQPTAELFADASEQAAADLDPPEDLHGTAVYRRQLARELAADVLATAASGAALSEERSA